MQRALVVAAVTAATVFVISLALFSRSHQNDLKTPGAAAFKPTPAPAFAATTLAGHKVSLAAYRGKPLVVNFFASWCAPCQEEATGFTRAEHQFAGRVQFLSIGRDSPMSAVHGYISRYGITWPVVYDDGNTLTDLFGLYGQPTTFVINGHGVIVDRINGKASETALAHELAPLVQS
jgi:cytochrome c biogenesis protein CcmG/thiol:disulfide interchange protein DsbE